MYFSPESDDVTPVFGSLVHGNKINTSACLGCHVVDKLYEQKEFLCSRGKIRIQEMFHSASFDFSVASWTHFSLSL